MTTSEGRPEPAQNPKIGSSEYFAQLFDVEERHWWSRGMRAVAGAMLDAHLAGASNLRVLDAGCGTGISLSWLEKYSAPARPVGIDVSALALDFCRRRGHPLLLRSSAVHLPFADGSFDLVVCNDVIQHLPGAGADVTALAEFGRVLDPGGLLMVRTNSSQGLANRARRESRDYRRYDRATACAMVREAGLEVVKATHANTLMSVVPTIKRLVRRREPHEHADKGLSIKLLPGPLGSVNTALYGLMKVEARLVSLPFVASPFGQTILVLARKPAPPASVRPHA